MGALVLACFIIPFALIGEYSRFVRTQPPLEGELTRASHGVVMIIVAFTVLPRVVPMPYQLLSILVLAGWGFSWLFEGAARSRLLVRDMRLTRLAATKVVFGYILCSSRMKVSAYLSHEYSIGTGLVELTLYGVGGWCIVTGLVKVTLLMRKPPVIGEEIDIDDMPHGRAGFGGGRGLRKRRRR